MDRQEIVAENVSLRRRQSAERDCVPALISLITELIVALCRGLCFLSLQPLNKHEALWSSFGEDDSFLKGKHSSLSKKEHVLFL